MNLSVEVTDRYYMTDMGEKMTTIVIKKGSRVYTAEVRGAEYKNLKEYNSYSFNDLTNEKNKKVKISEETAVLVGELIIAHFRKEKEEMEII